MDGTRLAMVGALCAALSPVPDAVAAGEPAALVLELTGDTEPALAPFTEIAEGTRLTLGEDAHISFVHYETCKLVTMTGGEVRVDRRRYVISRGRVEAERSQDCPRRVELSGDASGAGLLLRGGDGDAEIPLRPSFVLVGADAGRVNRIELRRDGAPVAAFDVGGRNVAWPDDAPDLVADTVYEIELQSDDGEDRVFEFIAVDRGATKLLILRLD